MKRQMFKSKIHRATVTEANLDYEGSITIDPLLLQAADILPYEAVHVWNITTGSRLMTYAIEGEPGKGGICVNGAGAKLCKVGDMIIIATFVELTDKRARKWKPVVVNVDRQNKVVTNGTLAKPDDAKQEDIKSSVLKYSSNFLRAPIGTAE